MADFNDLLRDQDEDLDLAYNEHTYANLDEAAESDNHFVPPVLAQAAEKQRRRMYDPQSPDLKKQSKPASLDDEEDNVYGSDPYYEKLKVLWLDELNSPDLLPWDEETFSLMNQLLAECHDEIIGQLR